MWGGWVPKRYFSLEWAVTHVNVEWGRLDEENLNRRMIFFYSVPNLKPVAWMRMPHKTGWS